MLHRLDRQRDRARPLFTGDRLRLIFDAVLAGTSPGTLWADDPDTPRSALLQDGAHALHLVGDARNEPFVDAVAELIARRIAPAALDEGIGLVKVSTSGDGWDDAVPRLFGGPPPRTADRVFARADRLSDAARHAPLPPGFRISALADRAADLSALRNFDLVTAEIASCWTGLDRFRRDGFGFCVHDATTIATWCTAEYVSAGRCGAGIETVPSHRRRGLATAAAAAFTEHCLARGIAPHWDAWADNTPSIAIAERVGFRVLETYRVHLADLRPAPPAPGGP